jgi:transcriptional regulator with XRE-family HTH domain
MYKKAIEKKLQEMHCQGMTYQAISNHTGISASNVAGIINGRRPVKNPSVDLFLKLFPKAKISFDGATQTINASGNANVAQTVSGNIDQSRHVETVEDSGIIGKIMEKVLDHEEFDAEEKVKFMKFIKKIEDLQ